MPQSVQDIQKIQNVQLTDRLLQYLGAIHEELSTFTGTRHGIFPPAGPLTVPFASSGATRTLARKQGLTVLDKTILFVINSEQDLARVFAEVRGLAKELNSIGRKLTTTLVKALGEWNGVIESDSDTGAPTETLVTEQSIDILEHGLGVFDRYIALTPSLIEGLQLLNAALARFAPARFGIFASQGPLTVVIRGSDVLRITARKLGLMTAGPCVVLFVVDEGSAADALGKIQQLSTEIKTIIDVIPPSLRKKQGAPAGENKGVAQQAN